MDNDSMENIEAENSDEETVTENEDTEGNDADEPEENTDTVSEEQPGPTKVKKPWRKAVIISAAAVIVVFAVVYFGGVWFYQNHFFFRTEIGSFDCSNMTVEEAKAQIESYIENYSFTFYERDGKEESVTGKEINLQATQPDNLDELLTRQNPFAWLTAMKQRSLPLDVEVTFSRDTLYNRITQLDFAAKSRENVKGSETKIYYENGEYHINDEGANDIISINDVYGRAKAKIYGLYLGMSLEKEGCYQGLGADDNVKGVLNLANKFVSSKITYKRGEESMVLDGSTINEWITIGEKTVELSKDKVREYVNNLAKIYNTVGNERKFKSSKNGEITVSGGDYGWKINSDKETEELCTLIWNGEQTEREPVYIQKALKHGTSDIGNTYVEVSIGAQHLWYYRDGALVVETDFVSGDPTRGNATNTGVYRLKYKDKNVVLKGQDYETPVSFWMPFNGGIGLHDATWRGRFGGSIYRGNGSHGCVNLPYSVAEKIYTSISPGDPVVVY